MMKFLSWLGHWSGLACICPFYHTGVDKHGDPVWHCEVCGRPIREGE